MSLDLGELLGSADLVITPFETKYNRLVGMMTKLGVTAEKTGASVAPLETGLVDVAKASDAAATGLGRADKALAEAGVSASTSVVAVRAVRDVSTEAALASSRLQQATLREIASRERLSALQVSGKATTAQLAAAQASLAAAEDRVAIAEERVVKSQILGAQSANRMRAAWEMIPGPVKYGTAALAVGAVEALKAASNYQKLTVNLVTGAGESQRNLTMVSDGILHMAGAVGEGADTLAKAMFLVESAGFHGAAGLTLLRTAAEGAKVDNADLTTVVDALTSAMNAYHEPASSAARVTNTLIASAAVGKLHLQDLSGALGTVLPSAAALRVPLDQVGAALATMTMQGTDANRAATYLRFSFAALANPTAKAQASMKAVGLTSEQVANTMTHGGLPAVFMLLQDAVGTKFPAGSAKYLAALANMVGGTRGLQAVLELTGTNLTTMDANLKSIRTRVDAAGNSVSDWGQVQKNLNVQWSEFIDGLGAAGIKIGEDLIPAATDLLRMLNDTGHVVGEVTGFFHDNETAASALAVVLAMSLEPALSRVAIAGATAVKSLAVGQLGAAGTALRGVGLAGLAGKVGVAALAIEALNAAQDIGHLDDNVKAARATLDAFSFTAQSTAADVSNYYGGALKKINAEIDDFDNKLTSFSAGDFFHRVLHPVSSVAGAINFDSINGQLDEAQYAAIRASSAIERVTEALGQIPFNENMDEVAKTMALAGINANDLSGSTSMLVGKVKDYLAANKEAKTPTAQAAQAMRDLGSGAQTAAQDVQSLTAALDLFVGNAITADQGAIAFRNDIAALDKALHHSHGSMDLLNKAGRDARDAFDTAAQQALNTAEAEAKLQGGAEKARRTLKDEIQTLKDHAGGSDYAKSAINRLVYALSQLPSTKQGHQEGQNFGTGYAQGITDSQVKVDAAASDLALAAKAATQKAQQSHSPSQVAHKIGQDWGDGLALGMSSSTGKVAASAKDLAQQVIDAAKSVFDSSKSKLTADINVRTQAVQGIQSSLLGPLGLSNAVINGGVGNLSAFLRAGVRPLRALNKDEARLAKMGLTPDLLMQIAGSDPNTALALATNILSGRSGSIHQIDSLERQARAFAKATGMTAADAQYNPRIAQDRRDVHDSLLELRAIRRDFGELKKFFRDNPHATGREVAAALDGFARNGQNKAHARTRH